MKIAVCIATKNYRYINDLLQSLEAQTHQDFQVYMDRSSKGVGHAKYNAVRMALNSPYNHEYIQMIDADDVAEPHLLQVHLEQIQDVDFVCSEGIIFGDEQGEINLPNIPTLTEQKNWNHFTSWGMFKRETLEQINFDPEIKHLDDWQLYTRLIEAGKIPKMVRQKLVRYRKHVDSLTNKTNKNLAFHKKRLMLSMGEPAYFLFEKT